jgi:hypothetical protein
VDRWIVGPLAPAWQAAEHPVVVDLGYGADPVTTVELLARLRRVRPDVAVVGVEIDPARVAVAQGWAADGLTFVRGGFEVPLADGRRPVVVRAFNVLRQYDEVDVGPAWAMVRERLAPGGVLIDGTCDELGRRATWIAVSQDAGPLSLTLSLRLTGLTAPSEVAERLPKALIHRNVPGERVHAFLKALDASWARAAPLSVHGARQRFVAAVRDVRDRGWPVLGTAARWRLGEVGVAWGSVAPGCPDRAPLAEPGL